MAVKVVAAAAIVAGAVFGLAEMEPPASESNNYRLVEKDRSWLEYLPNDSAGSSQDADIEVASMTRGGPARRINLLEKHRMDSIALCFAPSPDSLRASCPGARALGRMTRPVDAPWVGQLGTSEVDFLTLLRAPAPTLDEAHSIQSRAGRPGSQRSWET
jgi:hypothetical protein